MTVSFSGGLRGGFLRNVSNMTKAHHIRPLVFSGPSGSGKSTLLKRLQNEFPDSFSFSISHTTRGPRPGEINGRDYYFVSREEFEKLRSQNFFLEWAEFSKNLYGTSAASVQSVLEGGKICVLDIDLQGVHSVKKLASDLNPRFIFVKPPSLDLLRKRLVDRRTETEESLELRLKTAEMEIHYEEEHPGFHDIVIVNDDIDVAYKELKDFIFEENPAN